MRGGVLRLVALFGLGATGASASTIAHGLIEGASLPLVATVMGAIALAGLIAIAAFFIHEFITGGRS